MSERDDDELYAGLTDSYINEDGLGGLLNLRDDIFTVLKEAELLEAHLRQPRFEGWFFYVTLTDINGGMMVGAPECSPDRRIPVTEFAVKASQYWKSLGLFWWVTADRSPDGYAGSRLAL